MARLYWIGLTVAVAAVIALLLGKAEVAVGAVCATPVGMFNYYLMARAMRTTDLPPRAAQGRILKFSLLRTLLAAATLFVAFAFGVDAMLGALIGVTAEMLTYMGDTVRLIRSMLGDQ